MTTTTLASIVLLGGFIVLMLLKVPVSFSLLISTIASALIFKSQMIAALVASGNMDFISAVVIQLQDVVTNMVKGVDSFSLLSIPFFILAGEIMMSGGISNKLMDFADIFVGRFRGGMAYVNILASTFFGAVSGSATADISSIGATMIPLMEK